MDDFLTGNKKLFKYYKSLGDKTFAQVDDAGLFWQYNPETNSIAIIVKHLWGNMLSRWTDFLTTDGEKQWRQRDAEFEGDIQNRDAMLEKWEAGWKCLFKALDTLTPDDLSREVHIRNQAHTVIDAINRQLAHYAYHVGQIVFVGKMVTGEKWQSLSIPKGSSKVFNADKFSQSKHKAHFTDEFKSPENEI